jgi:hypothetical protein
MASTKRSAPVRRESNRPTAKTPDERENQLIEAAVDLAEQQLRSGEASAQVITHYLKLGSSRERLEQQRLTNEVLLLTTKRELMESEKRTEALMVDALNAMRGYMGVEESEQTDEYDDYTG